MNKLPDLPNTRSAILEENKYFISVDSFLILDFVFFFLIIYSYFIKNVYYWILLIPFTYWLPYKLKIKYNFDISTWFPFLINNNKNKK